MKILQTNIHKSVYKELNVDALIIDDVLIFNIFIKRLNNYVIIIEAGTTLNTKLFEKLQKQEKLYISQNDKNNQALTHKNLSVYIKYNKHNFKKSIEFLYSVNNKLFADFLNSDENIIDIILVENIVKNIIYLLKHNDSYTKDTIAYFNVEHELSYHSLHVAIYAISIGYLLNLNDKELTQLGISGLLHDLGIKKINDSIKNKDAKLSLDELEAVHQHSKYSTEIIEKNYIHDPYIIDAVMHHHESHDGMGYPDALLSEDISSFASILSISDVFDALTNDRPYRKKYSTFNALKIMMKDDEMVNKFNQEYLKLFLKSFLK